MTKSNNSTEEIKPKKISKTYRMLKGMRDILPDQQVYWEYIRRQARAYAVSYGYDRIELPFLEPETLFTKTLGKNSDIVEKELFTFVDEDNNKLALRPECTVQTARAYLEHALYTQTQPVRLFYDGPVFRKERQGGHRYSQMHQYGFETIGSSDPMADAQSVFIVYKLLVAMGLTISVQINSVGNDECRAQYKKALSAYLRTKRSELPEEARKLLTKDPLRILTFVDKDLQPVIDGAPQMVEFLDDECQQHLMKVLEYLDELEVPYFLNHAIIHDQEYYSHTVFQLRAEKEGKQPIPVAGGGRYDHLVEQIGGDPTPACGVAMNIERIIKALREFEVDAPTLQECDVFVAQIGEDAKKKSLVLFEQLRTAGFYVAENLAKDGLRGQLEAATNLGVKYALILGQKEIMDGTIMVRDMENGIQEIIDFQKVVGEMEKRLSKQLVVKEGK